MSRSRKAVTQNDANEMIQSLNKAGYTRGQLVEALDQFSPEHEEEERLLTTATALSLSVPVGSIAFGDLGKLKASATSDGKGLAENDYYIAPEGLVQDDEVLIQLFPRDQRKRVASKDSDSSTDTIIRRSEGGGRFTTRLSLGSNTVVLGERGRTLSGLQVEHALAYVVYESIAKKAIVGQKISEVSGKIMDTFYRFR